MSEQEVHSISSTPAVGSAPAPTGAATPTLGAASARAASSPEWRASDEDAEDGWSPRPVDDPSRTSDDPATPAALADLDGDGTVTPEEQERAGEAQDLDGDGRLSEEELLDDETLPEELLPWMLPDEETDDQDVPVDEQTDDPAAAKPVEQPKTPQKAAAAARPASPKGPTVMNQNAPAGFLWKPVSDSDGNLAILLPPGMTGKVTAVRVLSPDGQVLEQGRHGGVGNGDREHFRFSRPGGGFPPNCVVQIVMKDGSQQSIPIPNPGMRNEGGGKG